MSKKGNAAAAAAPNLKQKKHTPAAHDDPAHGPELVKKLKEELREAHEKLDKMQAFQVCTFFLSSFLFFFC